MRQPGKGIDGLTKRHHRPSRRQRQRACGAVHGDHALGATSVRARFWLDGTTEPTKWSIDAKDSSSTRLTGGRLGLWSAMGGGYIDDMTLTGPSWPLYYVGPLLYESYLIGLCAGSLPDTISIAR